MSFTDDFKILKPRYEGLLETVKFSLDKMITNKNIKLFDLEGRVKDLGSITNKISRKQYLDPQAEMDDICGIRIVCFYTSDMDSLEEMIKEEFIIISSSDKQKEAEVDRFGYQSRHYVVTLKQSWLTMPVFKDFNDLKIEIQLRTMLMHTWAAISHKLLYKHESDAPKEIKRKLNRLSALIELADEQFNDIKELKENYSKLLEVDEIDKNRPINADSILMLVNKYSAGRKNDEEYIPQFLDEVKDYNLSIADFENLIIKAQPSIERIEPRLAEIKKQELPLWSLLGYCRVVCDLTLDDFFQERFGHTQKTDYAFPSDEEFWKAWLSLITSERQLLASGE